MNPTENIQPTGIEIAGNAGQVWQQMFQLLASLDLLHYVKIVKSPPSTKFVLQDDFFHRLAPQFDTTLLCTRFGLDSTNRPEDLDREIILALLAAPRLLNFPSFDEFISALNMRKTIVRAAQKTHLAFKTSEAERPAEYWQYDDERGFTVRPGKSLITALEKATQPELSGSLYSFSCYRASEYVLLLAIAKELERVNPQLFNKLQSCFEQQPIKSGRFHDAFLVEYGSSDTPLPMQYYIPGGRVWFKNPDRYSSDVSGYEGSWVFYLGNGLFSNFWKRNAPFTLKTKCIEIYHWRNAVYVDQDGEPRIHDVLVDQMVAETLGNPADAERIFASMMRLRDPAGQYADGGCVDLSREYPRYVCPDTATIAL